MAFALAAKLLHQRPKAMGVEFSTVELVAIGVGSLANGTSDSHALRASGRATRIETL